MIHSKWWRWRHVKRVVNWFQIDTFMWWFTVYSYIIQHHKKLWIDFKLILLCDDSQYRFCSHSNNACCELISNWYFYVMIHSSSMNADVNSKLWIDFKLILLCDDSQLVWWTTIYEISCELISNWYFYVMIHSLMLLLCFFALVVNWFQIDTFMWWFTVVWTNSKDWIPLWIDFKLILLCDDSQFCLHCCSLLFCCELISNWYFYVMIHSTLGVWY